MEPYFFEGVVLPERAPLTFNIGMGFTHITTQTTAIATISIILNQVAVWIDTDIEWDIFDLRNVVKTMLQNELALFGYIRGFSYDVDVKRVVNRTRNIDCVFGIDIPCLAKRNAGADIEAAIAKLRTKVTGADGVFLHRCFSDLVSAMKHADDTGFYCYRALESLRQHCGTISGIPSDNKKAQWAKFRDLAKCDEAKVMAIKAEADPLRHGGIGSTTAEGREQLLTTTWDIVDEYVRNA